MLPTTIALVVASLLATCSAQVTAPSRSATRSTHTFTIDHDHFALDGKPFKILSGELHYSRIPREYWHARLQMARAMGLNTIATYVFWNVHEPTPGQFDFTGNNDLAAFIRAAQQEGLYVILRSGPYACAEWDFGGLPSWLVRNPADGLKIRSNDPTFMLPTERWIKRLAQQTTPLQVGNGGPILMTQIENEYGNFSNDHAYMQHLKDIYQSAGFNQSLIFSADNWRNIPAGSIPGLYAATNFGIGNHQGGMDALAKERPTDPLFVSEYWPGWFDHWGHPHETRPIAPQLEDIDYILNRGAGINIYMFHGGTSFGFMAGATGGKDFLPDVTSYDYDAPLDESGRTTPKFLAYRHLLAKFSPCGDESCLPAIPTVAPPITTPAISLASSVSLFDTLPTAIPDSAPRNMEHYGQNYGYILYRTQIPAGSSDLTLTDLHDFAAIYLNGSVIGTLDSRAKQTTLPLQAPTGGRLDILVANDGRINSSRAMRNGAKGILGPITFGGSPISSQWQIYPLPMTSLPRHFTPTIKTQAPHFSQATFNLATIGDTFLDIRALGKGAAWINGHPIGRFWNVGPQQTLYVPAPWLRKGRNEIIVFDLLPSNSASTVSGLARPILDGPTPEQTKSKQE